MVTSRFSHDATQWTCENTARSCSLDCLLARAAAAPGYAVLDGHGQKGLVRGGSEEREGGGVR
jgi:hypothetical protein